MEEIDLSGQEQDDALLAELRGAARVHDGPPPGVLEAARGSFTWRTIDAELAALAFDSALDTAPALVRNGTATHRLLTFEAGAVTVEMEIAEAGPRRRIAAQLVGDRVEAEIDVETPAGTTTARTDGYGRLRPVEVEAGPVRLRVRLLPDGPAYVTDWVSA